MPFWNVDFRIPNQKTKSKDQWNKIQKWKIHKALKRKRPKNESSLPDIHNWCLFSQLPRERLLLSMYVHILERILYSESKSLDFFLNQPKISRLSRYQIFPRVETDVKRSFSGVLRTLLPQNRTKTEHILWDDLFRLKKGFLTKFSIRQCSGRH